MRRAPLLLVPLLAAIACSETVEDPPPADDGWGGAVDLGVDVVPLELRHDFGTQELAPAEEIIDICLSWTLQNDEPLFVAGVELTNGGFWHHSNWLFVPEANYAGPDGAWPCSERGFHELDAAVAGGVLYAQSTQAERELQRFPPGAVVRLPPRAKVIASAHFLNYTTKAQKTWGRMRLFSLPESAVQVKLTPFRLEVHDLTIPAKSRSRVVGECELASTYSSTVGRPLDLQLHYLLPHTHALGFNVTVQIMGGPRDGEVLHSTVTNNFEANGKAFDPPVDFTGATGFRFWCAYDNPRDEIVRWGFGDQEMCEILGYADSGMLFDAQVAGCSPRPCDPPGTHLVEPGTEAYEAVAEHVPTDAPIYTAECRLLAVPWDP